MTFNCKDELVELLRKYGYNLVLLPRENIVPLQIFARTEKGLLRVIKDVFTTPVLDDKNGMLGELFITDSQPLPTSMQGDVVNEVKGKRSSEMGLDAGVDLMFNFLSLKDKEKTEEQKLKLKAVLKSIDKVNFAFGEQTTSDSVSHIALDSYMKDAEIRDSVGHTFREMIEKNQIYIVTSVLKSSSFTMKGTSEDHASVTLNLPKVKEILAGKIEGNIDVFEESGIKYKGDKQLVFGFKAVRLLYEEKDGKVRFKIKNQDGMAVRNEEEFPVELMNEGVNFIDLI